MSKKIGTFRILKEIKSKNINVENVKKPQIQFFIQSIQ